MQAGIGDTPAEREIRDTATRLWREVEWDWYRQNPGNDVLYWHWSPDYGFHIHHPGAFRAALLTAIIVWLTGWVGSWFIGHRGIERFARR